MIVTSLCLTCRHLGFSDALVSKQGNYTTYELTVALGDNQVLLSITIIFFLLVSPKFITQNWTVFLKIKLR